MGEADWRSVDATECDRPDLYIYMSSARSRNHFFGCFSEKVGCGLADVRCGDATECDRPLGVSSCNDEQGQHDFRQFLQGEQLAERRTVQQGGESDLEEGKIRRRTKASELLFSEAAVVSSMTAA